MSPIFFTLHDDKHLMIIPDTQAHLNGHAIITFTYSIYIDKQDGSPYPAQRKENTLHLDNNSDPDYYGFITFEKPGSLFTYTSDGQLELTAEESNEVIEHLSHIRDDGGWKSDRYDTDSTEN
ncbi:hypothetical protein [Mucilaginibacter sp.]|uniref:hypothetical protein n=1 Tax=Mucilaginibacter sp. TaxID=1882438 RepID=UPI0035BBEAA0